MKKIFQNLHFIKVISFFLLKKNKAKYLLKTFAKALERGTNLYVFISLNFFLFNYFYDEINNILIKNPELIQNPTFQIQYMVIASTYTNLLWYIPCAFIYAIYREINFDFKSNQL